MTTIRLNTSKNLLAFSAGIDSTALFFLLLDNNIAFDIAIVDYNMRAQSKEEVAYAKKLAQRHNKQCFIKEVHLKTVNNFEKQARDIRYSFFEELIQQHEYETLLTAHQLNDQLEWFFMQLSKGAGLIELVGLQEKEYKKDYLLYRPLLDISKAQLKEYLEENHIQFFIDESNHDTKYTRNRIRKDFSEPFLQEHSKGIARSFQYLKKDIQSLYKEKKLFLHCEQLEVFHNTQDNNLNIRLLDKSLKKRGLLLSHAQRNEILKQEQLVVSHRFSIAITKEYLWLCPYVKTVMTKAFKEKCRVLKIPKNIRGYLFIIDFDLNALTV